jgi:hypothetical protein
MYTLKNISDIYRYIKNGLGLAASPRQASVNIVLTSGFLKSWEFHHQTAINFSTNILHHVGREVGCDTWIGCKWLSMVRSVLMPVNFVGI